MNWKMWSVMCCAVITAACNKGEGTGGKATVSGNVEGIHVKEGKSEVIEITVTPGLLVEHGDYFIFNQLSGDNLYFWYNNPAWVSDGDPHLQGRTGVQVNFNYDDSNLQMAQGLANTMQSVLGNAFTVEVNGDILIVTSNSWGDIVDPSDMTTPFVVDVSQQGELGIAGTVSPITDTRVYLIYGDGNVFDEVTSTGADGYFAFHQLRRGDYQVYVMSLDSNYNEVPVLKSVTITDKKETVDAGTFSVNY
jgi:hypothetical protein